VDINKHTKIDEIKKCRIWEILVFWFTEVKHSPGVQTREGHRTFLDAKRF